MCIAHAELAVDDHREALALLDGPGPAAGLGGSSGVVVLPLLVIGALFVEAGRRNGDQLHWHWPTTTHPAH